MVVLAIVTDNSKHFDMIIRIKIDPKDVNQISQFDSYTKRIVQFTIVRLFDG